MSRLYEFTWDLIGNLQQGRPNLGPTTRVEVYRLMQFCLRDLIEREVGTAGADRIFFEAGKLAGRQLYEHMLGNPGSLDEFVAKLQELLRDMQVGVLRVEEVSPGAERLILTVAEDLDCSGLPELNHEVCTYDEGFIAALLECYTGKPYGVKEIDCWCTGDRTCRFEARLQPV